MNKNLKFTDEAQAISILFDGETPRYLNIDTIGVIYEGGAWDAEGNVITEPVALDGWHVNVFVRDDEDGAALEAYEVFPTTPMRVWA